MPRSREEIYRDVVEACPAIVSHLMQKSGTQYYFIQRMVKEGLLYTSWENPSRFTERRRKHVKVYKPTEKGRRFASEVPQMKGD